MKYVGIPRRGIIHGKDLSGKETLFIQTTEKFPLLIVNKDNETERVEFAPEAVDEIVKLVNNRLEHTKIYSTIPSVYLTLVGDRVKIISKGKCLYAWKYADFVHLLSLLGVLQ